MKQRIINFPRLRCSLNSTSVKDMTILIPTLVGLCIVLQGAINQKEASKVGLSTAIFINCLIALFLSGIYFFWTERQKLGTVISQVTSQWNWSFLIPGVCGFLIIVGVPLSINKVGALKTFLMIVVAQTLFSVLWDTFFLSTPFTGTKALATLLCLAGVGLLTLR